MNSERKKNLSGVDWGIILIVFFCLIAGGVFLYRSYVGKQDNVSILYRLCMSDLSGEESEILKKHLTVGSSVRSENGTAPLGTVTAVEILEHREAVLLEETVQTVTIPNRFDVYLTVEANASYRMGNGYRASDIRIAAGGTGSFRIGDYYAESAKIYSVKVKE